jgi:circadian clock protein KaiB
VLVPDGGVPLLLLRLYVAGDAPNSVTAVANLRAICETHFPAAHEIEIVDILRDPGRAMTDGIVVSPTLLRVAPSPARRVIGNLNDASKVLLMLANR